MPFATCNSDSEYCGSAVLRGEDGSVSVASFPFLGEIGSAIDIERGQTACCRHDGAHSFFRGEPGPIQRGRIMSDRRRIFDFVVTGELFGLDAHYLRGAVAGAAVIRLVGFTLPIAVREVSWPTSSM